MLKVCVFDGFRIKVDDGESIQFKRYTRVAKAFAYLCVMGSASFDDLVSICGKKSTDKLITKFHYYISEESSVFTLYKSVSVDFLSFCDLVESGDYESAMKIYYPGSKLLPLYDDAMFNLARERFLHNLSKLILHVNDKKYYKSCRDVFEGTPYKGMFKNHFSSSVGPVLKNSADLSKYILSKAGLVCLSFEISFASCSSADAFEAAVCFHKPDLAIYSRRDTRMCVYYFGKDEYMSSIRKLCYNAGIDVDEIKIRG